MTSRSFELRPFPSTGAPPDLKITGDINRRSNTINIRYELFCHPEELVIPAPESIPARKDELWRETCFEFFLAVKDSPGYWEFNLSPAGHWNVYRFSAYREGMEEETAFSSIPFNVRRQQNSLSLILSLDLDEIIRVEQPLDVAISAVIEQTDGRVSYWALTHHGPQADFHRRDGFIIELSRDS